MRQFNGFPRRMQFTPVPNLFFSALLPQIDDIIELKTIVHFFELLHRKRGYPRFVSFEELKQNRSLVMSLRQAGKPPEDTLREALEKATRRGIMLHLKVEKDGAAEDIYFLNTESESKVLDKVRSGELVLTGLKTAVLSPVVEEEPPDIFTLYEQNIGMLTPIIADELQEAEKIYPIEWIRDAIREAVAANKRKWSYVSRILETWGTEGKRDGTYRGDSKKTDPDYYIKGKYGDRVQR